MTKFLLILSLFLFVCLPIPASAYRVSDESGNDYYVRRTLNGGYAVDDGNQETFVQPTLQRNWTAYRPATNQTAYYQTPMYQPYLNRRRNINSNPWLAAIARRSQMRSED